MSKSEKRSKRHTPEQIVAKLRDADAMLNAGKDIASVPQSLGVSEATLHRRQAQYGGMKSAKTRALKQGMMQELLTGRTRLVPPPGATT